MKFNRWTGDPAIKITSSGARMLFISGQCIMDTGLENAAQISLFTRLNWWGNTLLSDPNQQIGSDFEEVRTIIDRQTINDKVDSGERALKWMQDTKLAERIEVTVTNPTMNYIQTAINIYPPGQDVQQLLLLKNGTNWINQAVNPAYERLSEVN